MGNRGEPEIRRYDEPFAPADPASDTGAVDIQGDGILVPHRRVIKTRADAPHLIVAMPIGGREETDIAVCEHCKKTTQVTPDNSYRAPGMVPAELLANFTNLMSPLGVTVSFLFLKNNLSAKLRESMTNVALEQNADFIFYWDDDTIVPGDVLYRMLTKMKMYPDIGAITGVYFTKMDPPEPVLYKDPGKGAYWGFNLDPNAEPEDVFSAGAGCLMVRVAAIRKMEPPYWADERSRNENMKQIRVSGHDIRFCRKLATESGYRMTVDGSVQCVHIDTRKQKAYRLPANAPPMVAAREMSDEFSGVQHIESERAEMPRLELSVEQIEDMLGVGANGSAIDH